ncbi:MAG: Extracellular solute-binding protein family 1 [uncultured Thiotrichaceae bacterium]|uniref:Extracellular solute-binding protein family 1 n=1 Tax=uncultured Thiotrichaceae bacterium TaxID=298394 RepID=A0A6S6T5B7_9GAMM|nr:MAG: Extracellular solute-binding protein family 1 [uncultured Thiotrichaceae bacterium]
MALLFLLLALGGCETVRDETKKAHRLLVWHSWPEPESELVEKLLKNYTELFPNIHIVTEYVPLNDIQSRFNEQIQLGMGPDLMIGLDVQQLCYFVNKNYLHELPTSDFDESHFSRKTLNAFKTNGVLYGSPFTATTHVLYFNKSQGGKSLANLESLIKEAAEDHRIGIPIDFTDAYWGIDAFNGSVFDKEYDMATDEGFIAWMQWIQKSLEQKNIIFDSDYEVLRDLFAKGELDYFIGKSRELPLFHEKLKPESVGVATLPAGKNKSPGGLLEVEILAINRLSAEKDVAVDLVNYLTNKSSQRRLANGGLGRIPVNDDVHLDPRLSPDAASLKRQKRHAITIPITLGNNRKQIFTLGDEINQQVLQGVLLAEDSADEFQLRHAELAEQSLNSENEATQ